MWVRFEAKDETSCLSYGLPRCPIAFYLAVRDEKKPYGPDWAMNDHMLRDIGLRRKYLERNAHISGFFTGFHDDHGR